MAPYTVVVSDAAQHDAGFRGTRTFWMLATVFGAYAELGLYWFLTEYFGRSKVALYRPQELLAKSKSALQTDLLFIGLPTSVTPEHLANVRFKKLVLYDSTDFHGINFAYSNKSFLLSQTNTCLKNWRDDRWTPEMNIGLLPIKRPPLNNRLNLAITKNRWLSSLGIKPEKRYDVGFVARPTGSLTSNQRLRWLVDLKSQRPDIKLWGGLVGSQAMRDAIKHEVDARVLESIWLNRRKIGFFKYFSGLSQSKVALAPSGYAPWTYRHFEAIYAGCVVVSNDLSHYEFFAPLPRAGMIEVPDNASVVPAVDAALELVHRQPSIIDENRRHLDQWLREGKYSRRCKDSLDRFMSQIG